MEDQQEIVRDQSNGSNGNDLEWPEGHSPVQAFSNAICRTFMQHFTLFRLTVCSRSLCVSSASCMNRETTDKIAHNFSHMHRTFKFVVAVVSFCGCRFQTCYLTFQGKLPWQKNQCKNFQFNIVRAVQSKLRCSKIILGLYPYLECRIKSNSINYIFTV